MTKCQWLEASRESDSFAFVAYQGTALLRLEVEKCHSPVPWRWAVLGPCARVPVELASGVAFSPAHAQRLAEERAREILLALVMAL